MEVYITSEFDASRILTAVLLVAFFTFIRDLLTSLALELCTLVTAVFAVPAGGVHYIGLSLFQEYLVVTNLEDSELKGAHQKVYVRLDGLKKLGLKSAVVMVEDDGEALE